MSNTQQRPMYDLTASGKRMKNIRISRGFSIKDVRDYMGFSSVQSIYKWESGQCFPQADNLLALANGTESAHLICSYVNRYLMIRGKFTPREQILLHRKFLIFLQFLRSHVLQMFMQKLFSFL